MAPPSATRRPDDTEPAHLRDPADQPFTIDRYAVSDDLLPLARRFWIPVWDVPAGAQSTQRVLQYPVSLIVISETYARFYGVVSGLSATTLEGQGWGLGLMLQPAAGALLTGRRAREATDRDIDVADVPGLSGIRPELVRELMRPSPRDEQARAAARAHVEDALRPHLPVDEEGQLVNAIVEDVEGSPELLRVDELCARFDIAERTLQRLLHKRLGIGPKWLIRRRRLQEAADRLRDTGAELAGIAAELGYADQAHFTRDFRKATGITPGEFAARFR
ncbi:AraC family transcriptional regulator [Intrasporangium oryzae NRRL B-24470]|uniref:AraC family transcriptional regulator n=1 Tax=Intrasporangium oryzae NRRL B-24470 TaxID=1386089 RepID=W9GC29_9MICO|nr:helix-turn-helix transcriptional regulator [Intrasporangium oryzae]EWT02378.1 AraC family transcriptional regulator [Intrasporangium oryzae NRRL B-24470]